MDKVIFIILSQVCLLTTSIIFSFNYYIFWITTISHIVVNKTFFLLIFATKSHRMMKSYASNWQWSLDSDLVSYSTREQKLSNSRINIFWRGPYERWDRKGNIRECQIIHFAIFTTKLNKLFLIKFIKILLYYKRNTWSLW